MRNGYIAEDGTFFDDLMNCVRYERTMRISEYDKIFGKSVKKTAKEVTPSSTHQKPFFVRAKILSTTTSSVALVCMIRFVMALGLLLGRATFSSCVMMV